MNGRIGPKPRPIKENRFARFIPPLSVLLGLAIWESAVRFSAFPAFILPPPSLILARFGVSLKSGVLVSNMGVTLMEIAFGLAIGIGAGAISGFFLAHHPALEQVLYPYIVATQAIPLAAVAPLFIIWLGSGLAPKILICSLVVFFPIQVSVVAGIREIPRNYRDVLTSMNVGPIAVLRYLEIPAVMPSFFNGLRISATLSVLGAVVGELSGAKSGLGYLINTARGQYDTAMVFVAVLTLMAMAITLYQAIARLEKRVLRWQVVK